MFFRRYFVATDFQPQVFCSGFENFGAVCCIFIISGFIFILAISMNEQVCFCFNGVQKTKFNFMFIPVRRSPIPIVLKIGIVNKNLPKTKWIKQVRFDAFHQAWKYTGVRDRSCSGCLWNYLKLIFEKLKNTKIVKTVFIRKHIRNELRCNVCKIQLRIARETSIWNNVQKLCILTTPKTKNNYQSVFTAQRTQDPFSLHPPSLL